MTTTTTTTPTTIIEVVEHPVEKFRFRYESEGRSNASITGNSSTPANIQYPKIRVKGFVGKIFIIISCVEHNQPYRQHPHKVYSIHRARKDKPDRGGVSTMERWVTETENEFEFRDIGITFMKRANIVDALKERRGNNINPYQVDWDHIDAPKNIDLHTVRLCFQVIGERIVRGRPERTILGATVTTPIVDKKSIGSLKVARVSHEMASVIGGQAVMLFCDKVRRDDIVVHITEETDGKCDAWKMECQVLEVHHQFAIAFQIPAYSDVATLRSVYCNIQLCRPSDGAISELLPFTLVPCEQSKYYFGLNFIFFEKKKSTGKLTVFFSLDQFYV